MFSCSDGIVTTSLVNNQIKVIVDSITTYRQIKKILQDNKTFYYIHFLPEERTLCKRTP